MKKIIIFTILWLVVPLFLLLFFDGTVTSKYKNYASAVEDRLFERGWLPTIIPTSSTSIVVVNDLDLNISEGEFSVLSEDLAHFQNKLKKITGGTVLFSAHQSRIQTLKPKGYEPPHSSMLFLCCF